MAVVSEGIGEDDRKKLVRALARMTVISDDYYVISGDGGGGPGWGRRWRVVSVMLAVTSDYGRNDDCRGYC